MDGFEYDRTVYEHDYEDGTGLLWYPPVVFSWCTKCFRFKSLNQNNFDENLDQKRKWNALDWKCDIWGCDPKEPSIRNYLAKSDKEAYNKMIVENET